MSIISNLLGLDVDLDNDDFIKLLREVVDAVQKEDEDDLKSEKGPQKKIHVTEKTPAIYPLVIDCANFCRLTYGIPTLPDKYKDITLDLLRKPTEEQISDNDKDALEAIKGFNRSLEYFIEKMKDLSDDLDILNAFKVEGLGGTSYIAVEKKKKYLIVAFKGTKTKDEWIKTNANVWDVSYEPLNPWKKKSDKLKDVRLHQGFYTAIKELEESHKIFETLKEYIESEQYKGYRLLITGHSLGGALASLFGLETQALGWNPLVVSLASPKIGFIEGGGYPQAISEFFELTPKKVLQTRDDLQAVIEDKDGYFINIVHVGDVVPAVPLFPYERLGGIPYLLRSTGNVTMDTSKDPNNKDGVVFAPESLTLDADDDLTELKENETIGLTTDRYEEKINNKLKEKNDSAEDEKEQDPEAAKKRKISLQAKIFKKIGDVLKFGIFDTIVENHLFYGLYAISQDGNPITDFIEK